MCASWSWSKARMRTSALWLVPREIPNSAFIANVSSTWSPGCHSRLILAYPLSVIEATSSVSISSSG
jgi:hypothetical protein